MTESECLEKYHREIARWGLGAIVRYGQSYDHPQFSGQLEPDPDTSPSDVFILSLGRHHDKGTHREDGPSWFAFHPDGSIVEERHHVFGKIHSDDGPAVTRYYSDGMISCEEYYRYGRLHREGAPALIEYNDYGWVKNDKRGTIHTEEFYYEGEKHKIDGPAVIKGGPKARFPRYEYWAYGRRHRTDGPSVYYMSDTVVKKRWQSFHLNGVEVPRKAVMDPKTINLGDINKTFNIETKRVLIELYGWPKYLKKMKSVVLDTAKNDVENTNETLLHCPPYDAGIDTAMRILLCACPSTARVYALELPLRIKSCRKAREWLIGSRYDKMELVGAS